MRECSLGLDIGTTGCKAVAFDREWRAVAWAYREYGLSRPGPGYELDPDAVWAGCAAALTEANARLPAGCRVADMAVSAIGDVIVPLDAEGRKTRDSIVDFDARGAQEIAAVAGEFGAARLFETTGMPPLFINSLPKILWIRRHEPDVFERTRRWATYEDFALSRLGLPRKVSRSLAARTMLFDIRDLAWSEELLGLAGLRSEQLPEPVASGSEVGTLPAQTAARLGFEGEVLVRAGTHDMVGAALAAGLDTARPGRAVDITGTMEGVVVSLAEPNTSSRMLEASYCCYPGVDGYATFSVNLTAGCVVKWFAEGFGRRAGAGGAERYDELFRAVDPAKPTGLVAIPHFSGSGNPDFDPGAKGCIYGLGLATSREEVFQGIVEGLCYELRCHLDAFEAAGVRIDELVSVGGGSRSPEWNQMKANITGRPVTLLDQPEASALGAALLAGLGERAVAPAGGGAAAPRFEPDAQAERAFAGPRGEYARLRELKAIFERGGRR